MYRWDSYFIQLGLLRDGRVELARDMTDNFLYEESLTTGQSSTRTEPTF